MEKDEHPDIQYIKTPEIGKVIAQGLAAVYLEKPDFPVDFLAKWLLNYCNGQTHEEVLEEKLNQRKEILEKQELQIDQQKNLKVKEEEVQKEKEVLNQNFEKEIVEHQFKDELLETKFSNYLQDYKKLTGVYIGIYDYPIKEIKEDDNDTFAHLDMGGNKVLRYISTSKDHVFMKENILEDTQGVTFRLFGKGGDIQQDKDDEDEDENEGKPKTEEESDASYVYVSDVVRNPKMHFFQIPKLGSYLAIPLVYENCLKPLYFEEALKDRLDCQARLAAQEEEKQTHEEEMKEELAALDEDDDPAEIHTKYEKEWEEIDQKPFSFEEVNYVICLDTLGQDRPICKTDREKLEKLVQFFAKSWTETERLCLKENIDLHMNYLNTIDEEKQIDGYIEEYDQLEEAEVQEREGQIQTEDPTELELAYSAVSARCLVHLNLFFDPEQKEETFYKKSFMTLIKYRVLCHDSILQQLLYFVGFEKQNVNLPKTNILDWKKVRTALINKEFFKKIQSYDFHGAKPEKVKSYQLVNRLKAALGKIAEVSPQREVEEYNLGYARIYSWFRYVLDTRIKDILMRRQEKTEMREAKKQAEEEHKTWLEEKSAALQEAKETFQQEVDDRKAQEEEEEQRRLEELEQADLDNSNLDESDEEEKSKEQVPVPESEVMPVEGEEGEVVKQKDLDVFDEEAWFRNEWIEEHPEVEIPPEIVDDIDNDYEDED